MIDPEVWPQLYRAFDPARRLWGDEVNTYYVTRPYGPLDSLKVHLDVESKRILLFGHTGSGKSSELARLVEDVKDDFFIVWIDSECNLDTFDATQIELLFLIGISIFQIAESRLPANRKPDPETQKRLVACLETLVRTQTTARDWELDISQLAQSLVVFGLGTAATLGSGVAAGMATAGLTQTGLDVFNSFMFKAGGQRQEVRELEVRPEIHNILGAVNDIITDIQAKSNKPLLLIVDGIDKFEVDQSKDFFVNTSVLDRVNCRTVYVTPLTLYYSADFRQAEARFHFEEFPNIALYRRDEKETLIESNYELFHTVVKYRIEPLGLSQHDLFADDALSLLIQMSGGVMREFIRLVQNALVQMRIAKSDQVILRHAEKAVYRARRSFKAGLNNTHYREMEDFLLTTAPSGNPACDELLKNLYILSYTNDDMWHDIHPNVKPLLIEWQKNNR